MHTINWFVEESTSHPFGQTGEKECATKAGAEALAASLRNDQAVRHVQVKGPQVDKGWVRNALGAWEDQYDHIANGNALA